jgi:hypothetical protein
MPPTPPENPPDVTAHEVTAPAQTTDATGGGGHALVVFMVAVELLWVATLVGALVYLFYRVF